MKRGDQDNHFRRIPESFVIRLITGAVRKLTIQELTMLNFDIGQKGSTFR